MTHQTQRKIFCQKGMSLVEVLVAVAVTSILVLIVGSAIVSAFKGQKGVDNLLNTTGFMTEIKQVVWREKICTENVKSVLAGALTISEGQVIDLPGIYAVQAGTLNTAEPLFVISDPLHNERSGIVLNKMSLVITKKITERFFIGSFKTEYSPKQQGAGAAEFQREFPVGVSVNSGDFAFCGGLDGDEGAVVQDYICDLSSDGDLYWNGTKCVSKYEYADFPGATEDTSTCPTALSWKIVSCAVQLTGTPPPPVVGKYGQLLYVGATGFVVDPTTNSCHCDMLPSDSGICTATCRRQIHFP